MPIRKRIILFGLGVVAFALFLFSAALYALFARGIEQDRDAQLARRTEQAVASLARAEAGRFRPHRALAPLDPNESVDIFLLVLGSDGAPISAAGEIQGRPPAIPAHLLAAAKSKGGVWATIEPVGDVPLRVHVRPWSRPDLKLRGYVVAAQTTRRLESDRGSVLFFLIISGVIAFICAGAAIWLVVGRALRPLKQMATLADEIGRERDLGRRLPAVRTRDEVGRLTASFNGMMDRLEDAYRQVADALASQKRFVADASHELRTPLTTIRSNAGFLLQHADARPEDRYAALLDIARESERMSRLVHGLLTLALADAGHHLDKAPLDLLAAVQDVCRQARKLHPARTIHCESADEVPVAGNEDALKQLLWILIDNAVKHTPEGGNIRVSLGRRGDIAQLEVADDGTGIQDAELERIFDRFYQADTSRSKGGAGLGLAIARWIVGEHGGHIVARNNGRGGATFAVALPAHIPARPDAPLRPPPGRPPAPSGDRTRSSNFSFDS